METLVLGLRDQDKTEVGYRTEMGAGVKAVLWIRNYYFFFPDPDPTLTLISDPDSDPDSNPDPACL